MRLGRRIILLSLPLLVGLAAWRTHCQIQQDQRDLALITAIKARDEDLAIRLIRRGADPNAYDIAPNKHLFWQRLWHHLTGNSTAGRNKPYLPTALSLVFDTDPYYQGGHGRPSNEEALLVLALLDWGANPNVTDEQGSPVLVTASSLGYVTCVRLLLEYGAKVNAKDADGKTALMVGSDYIEVVQALLAYGADVEQRNKEGATALHYAVRNFRPWTRAEAIRALLHKGANINAANQQGQTALMYSASDRDVETARLLLLAHARVDCRNKDGLTALGLAEQGVRENTIDNQVSTLLRQAGVKK